MLLNDRETVGKKKKKSDLDLLFPAKETLFALCGKKKKGREIRQEGAVSKDQKKRNAQSMFRTRGGSLPAIRKRGKDLVQ